MEIDPYITKAEISKLKKGDYVRTFALMMEYNKGMSKKGSPYFFGTLQMQGLVGFKVWSNAAAVMNTLDSQNFSGQIVYVEGTIDDFGGVNSIIVSSFRDLTEDEYADFSEALFLPVKYDKELYMEKLDELIHTCVSKKGGELCDKILFGNKEMWDAFTTEFAAKSHHDNCVNGLLVHTYKVVEIVMQTLSRNPHLVDKEGMLPQDACDLYMIGALLHDIGKVKEMHNGVYQPLSFVTHRYYGIDIISQYKYLIVANYSEEWYYKLISIILQHHGEYGERPKTIVAQVIHLADAYDAAMTTIETGIESAKESGAEIVKYEDNYLFI